MSQGFPNHPCQSREGPNVPEATGQCCRSRLTHRGASVAWKPNKGRGECPEPVNSDVLAVVGIESTQTLFVRWSRISRRCSVVWKDTKYCQNSKT